MVKCRQFKINTARDHIINWHCTSRKTKIAWVEVNNVRQNLGSRKKEWSL